MIGFKRVLPTANIIDYLVKDKYSISILGPQSNFNSMGLSCRFAKNANVWWTSVCNHLHWTEPKSTWLQRCSVIPFFAIFLGDIWKEYLTSSSIMIKVGSWYIYANIHTQPCICILCGSVAKTLSLSTSCGPQQGGSFWFLNTYI